MTACQEAIQRNAMVTAQALGTTEKSAPEAPARSSRCPSLLLPFPHLRQQREREQEEIFSLGFQQKQDTHKRDFHTQTQASGSLGSMRKEAEFKEKEKKYSGETCSSTSWTRLTGKVLPTKSIPGSLCTGSLP